MSKRSISDISLVNRKQPRVAMPCLYRRVVPQRPCETADAKAAAAAAPPEEPIEEHQLQVEVTIDSSQHQLHQQQQQQLHEQQQQLELAPVVIEPEPEPVVSPLIKAAALLNKMIDRRDVESCFSKCVELVAEDQTGFVQVALSLRSLRSRDQRHVVGQLLAQLLDHRLISAAHVVTAINQVLGSRSQSRFIVRGYADMLAPLFVDESGGLTVLGLLSSLSCLSVKQLEKLHDSIGLRLRDLVDPARARLLLPPAIDWAAFKEHQSESAPSNEAVRERRMYIKARCREPDCAYVSTSVNNLRHHLTNVHQMNLPESRFRFAKTQEFSEWLAQLERNDGVQFVRDHLANYMCSWRGVDPSRRNRASIGGPLSAASTGGMVCTAGFYVKSLTDGGVEVSAFLTHYHQTTLLAYGVVDSHFLDVDRSHCDLIGGRTVASSRGGGGGGDGVGVSVGGSMAGDGGDGVTGAADHLTDVVFIDGGLDELERDVVAAAAATAVTSDVVIDDMRRGFALFESSNLCTDMNVVLYKEPQVAVSNSEVWRLEDFALSMASDEQLRRLSHYGGNVLCLSGAEDTPEGSVFHLITISVVDECQDGWPVVWLLSNRCDELVITELIKHVGAAMEERGLVFRAPLVLLTDSTALHRGWCSATDTESPLFICPWHVQLAWENALPLIQLDDKCEQVRSQLLQLLRSCPPPAEAVDTAAAAGRGGAITITNSEQRVRELTLALLKDPLTQLFGKYFRDSWLPRQHEWTGCQLAALVANSDLAVRGLQRSTEDVTVGRTNNTSIAGCVQDLLEYLAERLRDNQMKAVATVAPRMDPSSGSASDPSSGSASDETAAGGVWGADSFTGVVLRHHSTAVALMGGRHTAAAAPRRPPHQLVTDDMQQEEEMAVEVVQVDDGAATSLAPVVWEVRDPAQPDQTITVEQWSDQFRCPLAVPCRLVCPACCHLVTDSATTADTGSSGTAVCLHQYSCSCPITSPCATLCPHIHLVHMHRLQHLHSPPAAAAGGGDGGGVAVDWQLEDSDGGGHGGCAEQADGISCVVSQASEVTDDVTGERRTAAVGCDGDVSPEAASAAGDIAVTGGGVEVPSGDQLMSDSAHHTVTSAVTCQPTGSTSSSAPTPTPSLAPTGADSPAAVDTAAAVPSAVTTLSFASASSETADGGNTASPPPPPGTDSATMAERRVSLANSLLALAVEVDSVGEEQLAVWQQCVAQMRSALTRPATSATSASSDNSGAGDSSTLD